MFMVVSSNLTYEAPQHLKLLDDYLLQVADGTLKRLIITLPPRHGKTLLTSTYFPVWFLGKNPDSRIILSSYGAELALKISARARDIFEQHAHEYFFDTFKRPLRIHPTRHSALDWGIANHLGGMSAAGVGGPQTGKGADCLLIDDPIKGNVEANSAKIRETTWDWFKTVAYTRLEPKGRIIVISTRWHMDDLVGRLLKEMEAGGEEYIILSLPAIAEEDEEYASFYHGKTIFKRKRGEAL